MDISIGNGGKSDVKQHGHVKINLLLLCASVYCRVESIGTILGRSHLVGRWLIIYIQVRHLVGSW